MEHGAHGAQASGQTRRAFFAPGAKKGSTNWLALHAPTILAPPDTPASAAALACTRTPRPLAAERYPLVQLVRVPSADAVLVSVRSGVSSDRSNPAHELFWNLCSRTMS